MAEASGNHKKSKMKFGFGKKLGLSFSWKRLLGISGLRSSIAQRTGIPTTKEGIYRKIGRTIVRSIFK
jgi:hypothetical protein